MQVASGATVNEWGRESSSGTAFLQLAQANGVVCGFPCRGLLEIATDVKKRLFLKRHAKCAAIGAEAGYWGLGGGYVLIVLLARHQDQFAWGNR